MIAYSFKEVRTAVSCCGCNEVDKAAAWWSGLRPLLFPPCAQGYGLAGSARNTSKDARAVVAGIGDPGPPLDRNRPASTMPATGHANFAGRSPRRTSLWTAAIPPAENPNALTAGVVRSAAAFRIGVRRGGRPATLVFIRVYSWLTFADGCG